MRSSVIKQVGHLAFGAGVASVVVSGLTYLAGRGQPESGKRSTGQFIGLWAPTLFMLAEMLDRVAEQDESYMGVPIRRDLDRVQAEPRDVLEALQR
ncbi:MAG: hypothetical protein VKS61_17535 [Candidatus Sericytochromatia bacterium]|nr:hypothetical protein [Candidatus Sericytochromatia bacterium]